MMNQRVQEAPPDGPDLSEAVRRSNWFARMAGPAFAARSATEHVRAQMLLWLHLIIALALGVAIPLLLVSAGVSSLLQIRAFPPFLIYLLGLFFSFFLARSGRLLLSSIYMVGGYTAALLYLIASPGLSEASEALLVAALVVSVLLAGLLLPRVVQVLLWILLVTLAPTLIYLRGGDVVNDLPFYAIMLGGGLIFYIYDRSRERIEQIQRSEIQAARDRLNHLLTTSPTVIYSFDKFFNPTYVSETVRRFGFTPGDFMVTPNLWSSRLHPEDREGAIRSMREVLRSGELTHEYRWQAADGVYHVLRDSLRLVRDAEGAPLEIVGTWSDVSEIRVTQEALTRSERLYRTLASNFPNGAVALYDHDLRFQVVGGADLAALGLRDGRFAEGAVFDEVFEPGQGALNRTLYLEALTGETLQLEISAGEKTYDLTFSPVSGEDGLVEYGLVLASDVTERKQYARRLEDQAEELRRATALAREANRLKSEFLATMSHELRTPLNAIIGFSEIMLNGMSGALDPDSMHMTQRIHANSQRLLGLINDVLDMAKIEAGRIEVNLTRIAPRKLFHSMRDEMSALAHNKQLRFDLQIEDSLPELLLADEGALRKILSNLLSNAIKFTEAGGVTLKAAATESDWLIRVVDSGIGIPPHAHNTIFEPFRQVDGSAARHHGGTGLGLAIVQELVRAQGGQVTVESNVGKGSVFTVQLPLQHEPSGRGDVLKEAIAPEGATRA